MLEKPFKIVLINDGAAEANPVEETLRATGMSCEIIHSEGCDEGFKLPGNEDIDVVLLDLDHGNGRGEETLRRVLKSMGNTPTVVLTDMHHKSLGIQAVKLGASNYMVKEHIDADSLLHTIHHVVEHARTERALRESDARYRRLLESVTDYIYTVQIENGRPGASSHGPGCAAVTGYTAEEYAADPFLWYRMIHEDDRQAVAEQSAAVLSGKTAYPVEHRIIHKDGKIRWIKNTPVPRYDRQGRLIAYDGLVSDVTERKWAEQELLRVNKALRESEEKLKQQLDDLSRAKKEWEVTFDAISNPVFIHDRECRIIRANKAYREAAGMSFQEIIGKPCYAVFPGPDIPFQCCEDAPGPVAGRRRSDEKVIVPVLNKVFKAKSFPVQDDGGQYLFTVHVFEDITEMKKAEHHIKEEMEITGNLLMIAEAAFTLDIDRLMENIVRCGCSVTGAEAVLSYLWDAETETYQPSHEHGLSREMVPSFKGNPLDGGLDFIRMAALMRTPVVIRAEDGCAGFTVSPLKELPEQETIISVPRHIPWMSGREALVLIPLTGKADPLGIIVAIYPGSRAFTERDRRITEGLSRQVSLALDEACLYHIASELFLGTVKSLSKAIDAKSAWTSGHSERVTRFALLMGKELGMSEPDLKDLELAGLLHDVGKIGTCDIILNKPGGLTPIEFADVKKHPQKGAELLQPIGQLKRIIPCVRHHHERYDGSGYPDGLRGEEIPLWARILCVADAFDAMTAERPYRKKSGTKKAIHELKRCSGTQFDPALVKLFIKAIKKEMEMPNDRL